MSMFHSHVRLTSGRALARLCYVLAAICCGLFWREGMAEAARPGSKHTEGTKRLCERYRKKAIEHQKRNLRLKCGFTGTMWHTNSTSHYNWCYHTAFKLAPTQSTLRETMLKACAKKETLPVICNRYAKAIVPLIRKNGNMRCGDIQRGTLWSTSVAVQRNLCMKVHGKSLETARWTSQRIFYNHALLACCSLCRDYAKESVAQYQVAQSKRCGYGPNQRWSRSFKQHFQTCIRWYAAPTRKAPDWATFTNVIRSGQLKFHKGWKHDTQSWRRGGRIAGSLSVVYDARRGQPSGFFRGTDGYLRFFFRHGNRWLVDARSFRRGGKVVGKISAVYSPARNHAEAFYQGPDGKIRYFSYRRSGWTLKVF